MSPRRSVLLAALSSIERSSHIADNTVNGDGMTVSLFHPVHTMTCQAAMNRPKASTFGHSAFQILVTRSAREGPATVICSSGSASVATATLHLFSQPVGDRRGERRHFG